MYSCVVVMIPCYMKKVLFTKINIDVCIFKIICFIMVILFGGVEGPDEKNPICSDKLVLYLSELGFVWTNSYFLGQISCLFGRIRICSIKLTVCLDEKLIVYKKVFFFKKEKFIWSLNEGDKWGGPGSSHLFPRMSFFLQMVNCYLKCYMY